MTIIKTAHTEKKREMKSMNAPAPVLFPMVDKELIQPLQVSNQQSAHSTNSPTKGLLR